MKRNLSIWSIALAVQLPICCVTQSRAGTPVKIEVVTESRAVTVGAAAQLRVNLLDPENQPAAAKKDVAVQVQGKSPSGSTETFTVLVKAGQSSGTVEMPAKEPGLVKLVASNRELASGGSVLNVRSAQHETPLPSPTPLASASPAFASPTSSPAASASPAIHFAARSPSIGAARMPAAARARAQPAMPSASSISPGVTRAPPLPPTGAAPPPPSAGNAWNPPLTFMYVPERKIWADMKDAATVYANLPPDEVAPWDMLIYVMSSVGSLQPEPIVIPKGQNGGKARLTYDRPAAVSVRFMSSVPWANGVSGLPLKITFGPTKLKMRANPPKIGLFESTEVAVQLADGNGNSVADDEKREVWLAVESGSGGLDQTSLVIEPSDPRVTTKFRPVLPGTVRFIAESPNLGAAESEVTVVTPILILILCAIGGLVGGLVAFYTDPNAKWPRIPIGVVTGFVLYWLLVFGLILIPNFPNILVFNPFSAAILAVIGGWLGTKVFSIALQKMGVSV